MNGKIAAMMLAFLLFSSQARAELVHGFADFHNGGFDFSEQQYHTSLFSPADLWLAIVDPPGGYFLYSCENRSVLIELSEGSLDDVTEAPADLSAYVCAAEARRDLVCVIYTADGLYVKLSLPNWSATEPSPNAWEFEYYVQTDGTRDLDSTVHVSVTTWGRIKQLYNTTN